MASGDDDFQRDFIVKSAALFIVAVLAFFVFLWIMSVTG